MLNTSTRSSNEVSNLVVINDEYIIVKNVNKGNTYNLYIAVRKEPQDDQNKFVLIKMRRVNSSDQSQESFFLNKLKDTHCTIRILAIGEQMIKDQMYHYQVMERHGPSLKLLYKLLQKNIPIQILCLVAIQTLNCLEQIHKLFIIHRNVRPKKLLISENGQEILLSDFKHACKYKRQFNSLIVNENYKLSSNKYFLNKFSSINQHLEQGNKFQQVVPSPKDDLEALALILIYYTGSAQVLDVHAENKVLKIKKLEAIKISLLPERAFKGAPLEFIQFLNAVKQTSLSEFPQDYEKFRAIFKKLLSTFGLTEKDIQYPHLQILNQHHQSPKNYSVNVIVEEQETQAQDSNDEDQSVGQKIDQLNEKEFHRLISLDHNYKRQKN